MAIFEVNFVARKHFQNRSQFSENMTNNKKYCFMGYCVYLNRLVTFFRTLGHNN